MQRQLLDAIENGHKKSDVPDFRIGDTVIIHQKLLDGAKERIQTYEGDVIARSGTGVREMVCVRKIIQGEGVERIFPVHSPRVAKIEIKKAGEVRRAKLYYVRDRVGKAVKIKLDKKRQSAIDASNLAAANAAAAAKAAVAKEQTATTGESKRAVKRKAKAEAAKK
jgi:large subunit ribosomal protein L19